MQQDFRPSPERLSPPEAVSRVGIVTNAADYIRSVGLNMGVDISRPKQHERKTEHEVEGVPMGTGIDITRPMQLTVEPDPKSPAEVILDLESIRQGIEEIRGEVDA